MRISTKVIGWLCVAIGFRPIWMTVLTGQNQATGNQSEGLVTLLFGVGGIALLLQKAWGWWLATIGSALMALGSLAWVTREPLITVLGLVVMAPCTVLLILDRPEKWQKAARNKQDPDSDVTSAKTDDNWAARNAKRIVSSMGQEQDLSSEEGRNVLVRRLAGVYAGLDDPEDKRAFMEALVEEGLDITGSDLETV